MFGSFCTASGSPAGGIFEPQRRDAPLRVGFDGRALVSPAGGVRRYVFELFAALSALAPEVEVTAIGAPAGAPLPPGVRRIAPRPGPPTNLGWSAVGLPLSIRRARGLGVFHAPAYTAPLWGARPLVLTIHDVSYERHPEWYPHPRGPLRRAFYRRSARAADRIITDSAFSRGEIVAAYGLDPQAIDVVPLGVGAVFGPGEPPPSESGATPYVLHVGDLHPRRQVDWILEAVLAIRGRAAALAGLRVRLAGVDRGVGDALRARAASAGDPGLLEFVEARDDAALVALLRGAAAFAYASQYEGFGLPVLEALACGVPVVALRAASIPEIAGDAAVLVAPDDAAGFTTALEGVLSNRDLAGRLREAGPARAASFTWRRTAELTLESYRRVV